MLRVIREVEPPTPSSRISTSEALPSLAANRQVEPARLSRLVRGDLDWIVMKALAKERERRYASADRPGRRPRAVPQPRAGLGRPADGGLPAEEVRAAEPGPGGGGGAGAAGAGARRGRDDAGPDRGPAAGADRHRRGQAKERPGRPRPTSGAGREAAGPGDEDERDPRLDLPGPRPEERRRRTASRCRRSWASGWTGRRPRSRGRRPATRWPWPGCR